MNFYTSVIEFKNKLLVRGVTNGKSYINRFNYQPTLYIPTNTKSKYQTLNGKSLKPKRFGNIFQAKNFFEQYKSMPEYKIYGMNRYPYQYIADEYGEDIKWSKNYIKIFTVDIECECEFGFPDPDIAKEPIICLTVKNHSNKQIITWGTHDFIVKKPNSSYIKCQNEKHLLLEFLKFWSKNHPDIVTKMEILLKNFLVQHEKNSSTEIDDEELAKIHDELKSFGYI